MRHVTLTGRSGAHCRARSARGGVHDYYVELHEAVRQKTDQPLVGVELFRKRLRHVHRFRFLRCGKVVPRQVFGAAHTALRAEFVIKMATAFEDERAGTGIVIWMDESYVHQHHRRFGTVVDMDDPTQWAARRRAAPAAAGRAVSKGKLHIVVHGITSDGLLVARGADGKRIEPPSQAAAAAAPAATAEWIWLSDPANTSADYHEHFSADTMCQWSRHRMFVAARAVYPGRRIWCVLDGSENHIAKPDDFLSADTCTKSAAVQFLLDHSNYTTIRPVRDGVPLRFARRVWNKNANSANPKRGGPSEDEVRATLTDFYAANPQYTRSRLHVVFDEEVCSGGNVRCACADSRRMRALLCADVCRAVRTRSPRRRGRTTRVIFSPPYESEAEAIEKVWAKVKQFVAKKDHMKRTPTEVRQHIADGFYGCSDFDGVTAGDCISYVSHAKGR